MEAYRKYINIWNCIDTHRNILKITENYKATPRSKPETFEHWKYVLQQKQFYGIFPFIHKENNSSTLDL